jgi:hypothetical protein
MRARSKAIVPVLLIAVVSLFFFQLTFGSFQSTHGPTATLEPTAYSVDFTMVTSAVTTPIVGLPMLILLCFWRGFLNGFEQSPGIEQICALRC